MADTIQEIQNKAAQAVFMIGHRSAGKGRSYADKPPKGGWIPSPKGDGYIQPEKLREALVYFDIALSILAPEDPNRTFIIYTKGLTLGELGESAEAEAAMNSFTGASFENADPSASKPDTGNNEEDLATALAQQFVERLLDKDYAGARRLLHPNLSKLTTLDLKQKFEQLFAHEVFPESAQVYDSWQDWTDKRVGDVAICYVSIDSENAEAVTVTVAREGDDLLIRHIEWGRP